MLSRRILRIKVLHLFYAYIKSSNDSIAKAEKELFYSLNKTYDLYLYLLLFLIEFVQLAEERIEIAKNKKIPSYEDLHPNTRLIDNRVIKYLTNNDELYNQFNIKKINWANHPELIKKFYKITINTDLYKNYMENGQNSFQSDLKFVINLLNQAVIQYDDLHAALEEESIYWNDDIEFVINVICKSLKQLNDYTKKGYKILTLFKNDEDIEYTKKLFRKSVINYKEHKGLVDLYAKNWDIDRIAFMDVLILSMALSEIKEFPSIPVKVSFNEYLEISKVYSTRNSSSFINGILDKIVKKLKGENLIIKQGRGLIGEI